MGSIANVIKGNKGLTLVEVLTTLALLSMVMILASSLHLFGQKQLNSQTADIEEQSDVRLVIKMITKDLRSANTEEINLISQHEIEINSVNYKFISDTGTLTKDGQLIAHNIQKFELGKTGNEVTVNIGDIPTTKIYIRD
jgi:prepilin-type N-terminal cleavage/methylation domain-containing protein